ncbi:MAG: hypothetical protein EP318_06155 [Rhodobacteraceae bacterium]|nr:MAG: hypothetical protein EP318_06155 [Paracoccaceae bacterium]
MKKPLHPASDHAVLRYLERVRGVDIEQVRSEIGHKVDLAVTHGATAIVSEGFRYVLSPEGVVITVTEASRTAMHIGSCKRKREIE